MREMRESISYILRASYLVYTEEVLMMGCLNKGRLERNAEGTGEG